MFPLCSSVNCNIILPTWLIAFKMQLGSEDAAYGIPLE